MLSIELIFIFLIFIAYCIFIYCQLDNSLKRLQKILILIIVNAGAFTIFVLIKCIIGIQM